MDFDPDEDRRLIKEVMQLSKLEDAKVKGKLNLDHLKRKNKPADAKKDETEPAMLTIKPQVPSPKQSALLPAFANKNQKM